MSENYTVTELKPGESSLAYSGLVGISRGGQIVAYAYPNDADDLVRELNR